MLQDVITILIVGLAALGLFRHFFGKKKKKCSGCSQCASFDADQMLKKAKKDPRFSI